jgi:hypothetical protein
MSVQQAGFPHWEAQFDEHGAAVDSTAIDTLVNEASAGSSDLFIFSHGWNNDQATARSLYERFFGQMRQVLGSRTTTAKIGTVGVIWPSMRWADEDQPGRTGGAASLASGAPATPSDDQLVLNLKSVFTEPNQQSALDAMAQLLRDRPKDQQALQQFQRLIGQLTGTPAPGKPSSGVPTAATGTAAPQAAPEDNGEAAGLLGQDAIDVFRRFSALAPQQRTGGIAGLGDVFGGLWNGAKEALRVASYWEMKKRAGTVGQQGMGPLLNRIQDKSAGLKVHLIGHSFGARLVSFALTAVRANPPWVVESVVLLQGAFSHFAFAPKLPQDPSRSGALAGMNVRVDGPLCVTFSAKDLAVGTAYPLASIAARDDSAALVDLLFRWGGMGHDGAQAVGAAAAFLGSVGTKYPFGVGSFLNLDSNAIISQGGPPAGAHSDIVHPEIAWMVLAAARVVS